MFETVELLRKRVCTVGHFSRSTLQMRNVSHLIDDCLGDLVVQLEMEVLCQSSGNREKVVSFNVPATWWQHFKLAKFPAWLIKRFPVRYRQLTETVRYEVWASYPRADIKLPERFGAPVMIALAS